MKKGDNSSNIKGVKASLIEEFQQVHLDSIKNISKTNKLTDRPKKIINREGLSSSYFSKSFEEVTLKRTKTMDVLNTETNNIPKCVENTSALDLPQPSPSSLSPNVNKIRNIVNELLSTEEAYVSRLELIDMSFRKYFLEKADPNEKSYPCARTVEDMFSNLSSIITFHVNFFLPDIKTRIDNWTDTSEIGDIFVKYGPHFRLYTIYINCYDTACANINAAIKKFNKFSCDLQSIEKKPECKNLRLTHHMLDPIQRIPRYKLLLQEVLKKTEPNTQAYKNLISALEIVSASAQKANDRIRETQNAMKMLEIQNMFVDGVNIVSVGRSFIKEGEVLRQKEKSVKFIPSCLFLFSDLIICSEKSQSNKHKKKFMADFSTLAIKEKVKTDKQIFSFSISGQNSSCILSVSSAEEKENWLESIKTAVKEHDDKTITFMVMNKSSTKPKEGADQHYVIVSKVILFNPDSNAWEDYFLALSPERKLILSSNENFNPIHDSFFCEKAQISKTNFSDIGINGILIELENGKKNYKFASNHDDLFSDRWLNVITKGLSISKPYSNTL